MKNLMGILAVVLALQLSLPLIGVISSIGYAQDEEPEPAPKPKPEPQPEFRPSID